MKPQKYEIATGRYQTLPNKIFNSYADAVIWARANIGLTEPWSIIADEYYGEDFYRLPTASDTFYTGLEFNGRPGGYLCYEYVHTGHGTCRMKHFWSMNRDEVENFAKKMNRDVHVTMLI